MDLLLLFQFRTSLRTNLTPDLTILLALPQRWASETFLWILRFRCLWLHSSCMCRSGPPLLLWVFLMLLIQLMHFITVGEGHHTDLVVQIAIKNFLWIFTIWQFWLSILKIQNWWKYLKIIIVQQCYKTLDVLIRHPVLLGILCIYESILLFLIIH